jgi:uncharacterized phage protein (TIGR01671 family)
MKEIKSRGKIKDSNTGIEEFDWAFGDLVRELSTGRTFICDLSHFGSTTLLNDVLIEVDPSTVGEFIGLLDKNGKEIYEGDILDAGDRIVKVKWNGPCGCWDTDWISYKGPRSSNGIPASEWEFRAKLIGNIHDNPELLKEVQ